MVELRGDVPVLDRAEHIADHVLFPAAQRIDRAERVPAGHLDALATAGLFDLGAPDRHDRPAPTGPEIRRILAAIAGGCGATFFVWAQHHGVVRALQTSPNRELVERWLEPCRRGSTLAGIAFAHLRRRGVPAIRAHETPAGWEFTGTAPWATSWGMAERFAVAAVTEDGRVVWALLPGAERPPSFRATALALPVLRATGTVTLHFDRHRVGPSEVLAIEDLGQWQTADRVRAAQGQTGVLGVADRAIRELGELGRDDELAAATASSLRARLDRLWSTDDEITLNLPISDDEIAEASLHRAECLRLGQSTTTALLAATGGRGMDLTHPAQRLAREATFYIIQAQTTDGREAALRSAN